MSANSSFLPLLRAKYLSSEVSFFLVMLFLPLLDLLLPEQWKVAQLLAPIFILSILALGLNIISGFTGLLNLGVAAFMALGAYAYAIFSSEIYPFQFGFWGALCTALFAGGFFGLFLGLPTIRLRGDYLAIVTLGFGEIVQDSLKNLEEITKGIQGISPLPNPQFFFYQFDRLAPWPWYYLFLAFLGLATLLCHNLQSSKLGYAWFAVRDDELASSCIGISPVRVKLIAFAFAAVLASLSGALWASFLGSSGEPGNYDFQISVTALCVLIVGGLGSIRGVLLGALLMFGFNSIVLVKLSNYLAQQGLIGTTSVFSTPNNWKYAVFGLALILTMRYRPQGLFAERGVITGRWR